ncbi:MAG: hypothetical protein ACI8S6_004192 [Myxococcota bacterium]|jgi:hypothetical protein
MDIQPSLLALLRSAITGDKTRSTTAVCPDRYAQAYELACSLGLDWWAVLRAVPEPGLPWMNDVRPWLDCMGISPHRPVLYPFCCDHVSRTLPLYAQAFPDDARLHHAVAVAHRSARGESSREDLQDAMEESSTVEVEEDWMKQRFGRLVVTLCQKPESNDRILGQLHTLSLQLHGEVAADDAVAKMPAEAQAAWSAYRERMSRYQMLSTLGKKILKQEIGRAFGGAWEAARDTAQAAEKAAREAERRVLWTMLIARVQQHTRR